ncbi:hypothetical protein [Herbiconiux sp.]|uniref:hypothetical protein n=1 Tax=Herbiconiux sp. TaxID=1871186 RepID=UPI0025C4D190|nr:hypothetical protein [Herbiconiux sp.]
MPTETAAEAAAPEHPQSRYQVRLHLAVDASRLASLQRTGDHVLVVDVLDDGELATATTAAGGRTAALPVAGFRTRTAAARAVLEAQAARGDRVFVDLVTPARVDGQFAVEDFLAAGAVVDALAELGIDFSSPEAAAACAAFTTLRRALAHLVTASAAGRSWAAAGRTPEVLAACALDADA